MAPVRTLVDSLVGQAQQRPSEIAVAFKHAGAWVEMTWREVLDEVRILSSGLVARGVKPGDRVAIFGATSITWILCDYAVAALGAITVPIYASNTPEECRYIFNDSEAVLVFVDNDSPEHRQPGRVTRIRRILGECPSVRRVVIFGGQVGGEREVTLAELRREGEAAHRTDPAAFDARARAIDPAEPCIFIYTSGTTGAPKGVMLTHRNWTYETEAVSRINVLTPGDSVMLFLPLAHVFAQVVKAAWVTQGFRLIIAESPERLLINLAETHPTVLPAVPRVFEKVYSGVVSNGSSAPGLKGRLFRWAMREFDAYVEAREQGREYASLAFAGAKRLVFSKVRHSLDEKLGGRMRLFVSGGAPLSRRIGFFFDVLGYKVTEGYGLTEVTAAATVASPDRIKIGTVGPALPGTELRIAPDGEVLIRGPGVMKGYFKNPTATAEVLEPDGWFYTGDIGELDPEGYLRITDRKKDIIVTAGGKNVAPQNLENQLKTHPLISQAMVYGDKRNYLTALISVDEESARKLLSEQGISVGDYGEICRRPEIRAAVKRIVDELNAHQPSYSTLKKFVLLDHDLTQEGGELTPTLKVKRKQMVQKYKALLDGLYEERAIE